MLEFSRVATWGFFNGKGSERHEARQLGGPLLPFPPTLPGREERLKWQRNGGGEAVVFFSGLKGDFFWGKQMFFMNLILLIKNAQELTIAFYHVEPF